MTEDGRESVKTPVKAGWNICGWHIQYLSQVGETKAHKAAVLPEKYITSVVFVRLQSLLNMNTCQVLVQNVVLFPLVKTLKKLCEECEQEETQSYSVTLS